MLIEREGKGRHTGLPEDVLLEGLPFHPGRTRENPLSCQEGLSKLEFQRLAAVPAQFSGGKGGKEEKNEKEELVEESFWE